MRNTLRPSVQVDNPRSLDGSDAHQYPPLAAVNANDSVVIDQHMFYHHHNIVLPFLSTIPGLYVLLDCEVPELWKLTRLPQTPTLPCSLRFDLGHRSIYQSDPRSSHNGRTRSVDQPSRPTQKPRTPNPLLLPMWMNNSLQSKYSKTTKDANWLHHLHHHYEQPIPLSTPLSLADRMTILRPKSTIPTPKFLAQKLAMGENPQL